MDKNYNIHFESKDLWADYDPKNIVKNKSEYIIRNIPEDVNSIIDVGCGNGIITNRLAQKYSVVGVDMSQEALKYLACNTIHSSSEYIPVGSRSFDMVFSSELLEHLPINVLYDTVKEIKRVSNKYIFITVPNNEFLNINYIKCPECGHIFHSYGHLNSFSENTLKNLFIDEDFELIKTSFFGPPKRMYNKFLLSIRQNLGNRWFPPQSNTICPNCYNKDFLKKRGNIISKFCNGLNLMFSNTKPYWILTIFKQRK